MKNVFITCIQPANFCLPLNTYTKYCIPVTSVHKTEPYHTYNSHTYNPSAQQKTFSCAVHSIRRMALCHLGCSYALDHRKTLSYIAASILLLFYADIII